jgi:hypothetical protein
MNGYLSKLNLINKNELNEWKSNIENLLVLVDQIPNFSSNYIKLKVLVENINMTVMIPSVCFILSNNPDRELIDLVNKWVVLNLRFITL